MARSFSESVEGNRRSAVTDLALAAGLWLWVTAVAAVYLFLVFPLIGVRSAWGVTGIQVAVYTVLAAPAVLWYAHRPREPRTRRPAWPLMLGVAFLLAGAAFYVLGNDPTRVPPDVALAHFISVGATGAGEEIIFRGAIWSLLEHAGLRHTLLITTNVVLFVCYHAPALLAGDLAGPHPSLSTSGTALATVAAAGMVLCLARLLSRGLTLPILLHIAIDAA